VWRGTGLCRTTPVDAAPPWIGPLATSGLRGQQRLAQADALQKGRRDALLQLRSEMNQGIMMQPTIGTARGAAIC
jgi:hypothetical protein